jgi:23S rRNA (pseudouridine1915-N3)-methyltransferase
MKLLLVAVGQRQPAWADAAWDDFAKRFPPEMRLELKAVKAEPRSGGKTPMQCMAAEAQRLEAAIPRGAHRVLLSEFGVRRTTPSLAERVASWRNLGRDVVFLVGGPDGVDLRLQVTAEETLRLSDLTLPHAFARVLLAEALYRAWTLSTGHPYHRE